MNRSKLTFVRSASELDAGSRIVLDGYIRTVVEVIDLPPNCMGAHVTIRLDNDSAIVDRARTLYTCV